MSPERSEIIWDHHSAVLMNGKTGGLQDCSPRPMIILHCRNGEAYIALDTSARFTADLAIGVPAQGILDAFYGNPNGPERDKVCFDRCGAWLMRCQFN